MPTLFADVILPLAISKTYTYRIPRELNMEVEVGKRVAVQFGKNKVYSAIVKHIHEKAPELYEAKYLTAVLDDHPIITSHQFELWRWIAEYYMCNEGDVMNAALPAALKLASETKIILNGGIELNKDLLNDKEYLVVEALEIKNELSISEVSQILEQKTVFPLIRSLIEKGFVLVEEEIRERFKPKKAGFVKLNPVYQNKEKLKELFQLLEKAPKQVDLLQQVLQLGREGGDIQKKALLEECGVSSAVLNALIGKNVLLPFEKEVSRLKIDEQGLLESFELSEAQQQTFGELENSFADRNVVLLHGVTSGGKTEIYIRLIEKIISAGKQALYLVPEIALTTQLINRLRKYFGNKIGVYHSKFSDNERVEVWNKVADGSYAVVLGARSSLFLPFHSLGLVVVDEEHENSYKQFDPAPRYHARDAAIYLAHIHGAKVLLGSATPSLESYSNALAGKYGLAKLTERYGGVKLPRITVVDLKEETRRKTIKAQFSSVLLTHIRQTLEDKKQVILFQNRRGYAPVVVCATCGYTPKCINCDVSLTYHRTTGHLHCHYCGYHQRTISRCPACGSTRLEMKGFGTEKVEDELAILLPDARIARMDLDTTRSKYGIHQILADFEDGKIDILVGTQMVSKGLDFDKVTLIGILNADSMLNYPDFRSFERSFQLMSQVSGRAGRREQQGEVIIQTYDTQHRIIQQVINNDFEGMYRDELAERQRFNYPPHCRLIQLDVKHKDIDVLHAAANHLGNELKKNFGNRVLGPEFPLVARIRNLYIKTILIKLEKQGISVVKAKELISQELLKLQTNKHYRSVLVQPDVDSM